MWQPSGLLLFRGLPRRLHFPTLRLESSGTRWACSPVHPYWPALRLPCRRTLRNRSRTGSRTSKPKETSEDVQSGSSQFISNLKTLSSKGRLMQRSSLSIDESWAVLTTVRVELAFSLLQSFWRNPYNCRKQSLKLTEHVSAFHKW